MPKTPDNSYNISWNGEFNFTFTRAGGRGHDRNSNTGHRNRSQSQRNQGRHRTERKRRRSQYSLRKYSSLGDLVPPQGQGRKYLDNNYAADTSAENDRIDKLLDDCSSILDRIQSSDREANMITNHVVVQQYAELGKLSSNSMFGNLNGLSHFQDSSVTKKAIDKQLSSEGICQLNLLEISLQCPLSQARIKVPVKSKKCQHLQCFDRAAYINMVKDKVAHKRKCPICKIDTQYEDLIVDGFLQEVLDGTPQEAKKIEFTSSTEWRVKRETGTPIYNNPCKQKKRREVIDLTNSPCCDLLKSRIFPDVIDLTLIP